jgi:hypothetical protein
LTGICATSKSKTRLGIHDHSPVLTDGRLSNDYRSPVTDVLDLRAGFNLSQSANEQATRCLVQAKQIDQISEPTGWSRPASEKVLSNSVTRELFRDQEAFESGM